MAILGRLALKNKNNSTTYANNNKEVLAVKQNEFFDDEIDSHYNKIDDDLINLTYDNNTGDTLEDIINGIKNDFTPLLEGTIDVGSISDAPTGALTVTGGISSANKTNGPDFMQIDIVFASSLPSNRYTVLLNVISLGTGNVDASILLPVYKNKSQTGMTMFHKEASPQIENLRYEITIRNFNGY